MKLRGKKLFVEGLEGLPQARLLSRKEAQAARGGVDESAYENANELAAFLRITTLACGEEAPPFGGC